MFQECVIRISQPLLLGRVINYFSKDSDIKHTEASLCALGVVLCSVVFITIHHPNFAVIYSIGMRIRVACCALMFKKVFSINLFKYLLFFMLLFSV